MTENVPNNPDPYSGIKPLVRLLCYLICFGLANYLWYQLGFCTLDGWGRIGKPGEYSQQAAVMPFLFVFAFTQGLGYFIGQKLCKMTTGSD